MLKGKKIWIVVGIIVILIIIFFVWKRKKDREMAIQAEQDRLNQLTYGPTGTTATSSGVGGTLDSVGGVIDSLSNLFGTIKGGSGGRITEDLYRQFENECEAMYNTQQEVNACVASKIQAYA